MFYERDEENDAEYSSYMLNLIDTPGHVDFSYEVTRSLAPCQGVLLLVDASQGIQAQTIATYEMATLNDLVVIPILTKIDLEHADPDAKSLELSSMFDFDINDIILTSSKTGIGIDSIFDAIIDRIPPPNGEPDTTPNILLYDSFWDPHRGVVGLVYVKDGCLRINDMLCMLHVIK